MWISLLQVIKKESRANQSFHQSLTLDRRIDQDGGQGGRGEPHVLLPGRPARQDPGHPPRPAPRRRLLLVARGRALGEHGRLLARDGRRHVERRGPGLARLPGRRAGQLVHARELDPLARQRRPGLLGHERHAGRREPLPEPAGARAPVAGARPGRLQHPGGARPPRRHVRRRAAVADLRDQQWVQLQEQHRERHLLQSRREAGPVHGQHDLLRLGGQDVGLDGGHRPD